MEKNNVIKKPVFKWAWQKLEVGDYTDIKEYKKAYKDYLKKLNNNKPTHETF